MKKLSSLSFSTLRRDPVPALMLFCLFLTMILFLIFARDQKQLTAAMPEAIPGKETGRIKQNADHIKARGTAGQFPAVKIRSEISGTLKALKEKPAPGHIVAQGQVLASIDQSPYLMRLKRAEIRARAARARLESLQQTAGQAHEQWNKYLTRKHFEPDPLELYQPAIIREQEKLATALSDMEILRFALEKTRIRAPFPARIVSMPVNAGEQIESGTLTAVLEDIRDLQIRVQIPGHKLQGLEPGNAASDEGSEPEILIRAAGTGRTSYRPAHMLRINRDSESDSKAELVLQVNDPLSVLSEKYQDSPVYPGAEVEIMININDDG